MINKRLVFQLSLFGLAMAFATVYFIPSRIEPVFWLGIFIICAYFIAKKCRGRYFLQGLYVSLLNAVWIISAHILLFKTYIQNHPEEASMLRKMPLPDSPRLMMLMTGLFIGFISGLILGLFSFVASKIVKQ
jgi:hypothetical protein